jgi:hypothetical protein
LAGFFGKEERKSIRYSFLDDERPSLEAENV